MLDMKTIVQPSRVSHRPAPQRMFDSKNLAWVANITLICGSRSFQSSNLDLLHEDACLLSQSLYCLFSWTI